MADILKVWDEANQQWVGIPTMQGPDIVGYVEFDNSSTGIDADVSVPGITPQNAFVLNIVGYYDGLWYTAPTTSASGFNGQANVGNGIIHLKMPNTYWSTWTKFRVIYISKTGSGGSYEEDSLIYKSGDIVDITGYQGINLVAAGGQVAGLLLMLPKKIPNNLTPSVTGSPNLVRTPSGDVTSTITVDSVSVVSINQVQIAIRFNPALTSYTPILIRMGTASLTFT